MVSIGERMGKTKSLFIMFFVSAIVLLFSITIIELTDLKLSDIYPVIILAGVINVFSIVYFFVDYNMNKMSVKKLQDEYIDGLTPKVPLRFCASDDELLKTYDEAVKTNDEKKLLKVIAVKTSEDTDTEIEREM